jgi:hypothetical protein
MFNDMIGVLIISNRTLKVQSSNFLNMTQRSISLFADDITSNMFRHSAENTEVWEALNAVASSIEIWPITVTA